jgi:hypothetical protein
VELTLRSLKTQDMPLPNPDHPLSPNPFPLDIIHITGRVRMILVDHIEGITMADAKLVHFSKPVRQRIFKSIVEHESRIFEDIWLTDLEPQNVMIASPDSDRPGVVSIDFDHALFNSRRDDRPLLQLNYCLGESFRRSLGGRKAEAKKIHFQDGLIGIGIPGLKTNLRIRSQA